MNFEQSRLPKSSAALEELLVAQILPPEALAQYEMGAIGKQHLAPFIPALQELSRGYVQGAPRAISPALAAAYALYYLPLNFVKILFLLGRIRRLEAPTARVLDFGSGPGTASLAALAALRTPLEITALDAAAPMRDLASSLIPAYASRSCSALKNFEVVSDIPANSLPYDLIFAANVINELPGDLGAETLRRLCSLLSPQGALVLLEPALFESTRALMTQRDQLLANFPALNPIFPCTRKDPCPMSRESPSDWCHGTLEGMGADFESFQLVQQFDALLEFNKHRIKYSALVLAANQALFPGYRVIGKPSQVTRGIEATICGADFFGRVRLPKSCLNDSNRALKKAGIYSLLQITPKPGAKLTESHAICPL